MQVLGCLRYLIIILVQYGAAAIGTALQHSGGLDIPYNNISCSGAAAIYMDIPHLFSVLEVNLSNNNIGSEGAVAVFQGVVTRAKIS